ncbi:MAG: sugar ABC transporter substrate-binding protein [Anaerolineales bacterium]
MRQASKLGCVLLSGLAVILALAACSPATPEKKVTIAYSGYATSNDFWNTLGKSAAEEAKAKGVNFIDLTTETQDAAAQVQAINTVITQKPSAIIIGSVDPNVFKDTIAKAKAAGIPILAVDTEIADPYISALIQTDNLGAAGQEGDYICTALNGAKGTALVMAGTVAHQTGDARQKGVADKLAACGEKVIKEYGNWDENVEVQIASDTIAANPDLNVIFAPHDGGAAAVAAMVKQKGLTDKIMVFGFDALPVMLKAIQAGEGTGTMKQDNVRMGKEIVDTALKLLNGETIEPKILIPGIMIDKNNVGEYLSGGVPTVEPTKQEIVIAYSGYATSNDFWNTLGKAAAEEAKAMGVTFIDLTTETQDASAQVQAINTVITQKPSAIIIGSVDPNVFKDTIAKAKAAGIPILAVDTAIDDPYISALIQTDNLGAAGQEGDYICEKLAGVNGTSLVMAGTVAHQTGDARQKGVADKLEACGEKVIKEYGNWDENLEVQIASDTIAANPDLHVIFAPHDGGAAAVAAMVKQKNLTSKIMVFGFDALPVMLKAIKAGEATGTMKQDNVRMGKEIVDTALKLLNGETIEAKILIPGIMIDITNVDQYLQ